METKGASVYKYFARGLYIGREAFHATHLLWLDKVIFKERIEDLIKELLSYHFK